MADDLFTTVIAVDANYVKQLQYSVLTWQMFRKEIFRNPLLVVIDGQCELEIISQLPKAITTHPRLTISVWPNKAGAVFKNQRDRMLSAFVHIPPAEVKTPWWLKVDCDAIAMGNATGWFDPLWFASMRERALSVLPDAMPLLELSPIIIAPGWNYTKPATQPAELDSWGNEHPVMRQWPPLNIPYNPEARTVSHKRFCSWVSFYRTDWTRWAASLCSYPNIPVPSQDGFHWYAAERAGSAGRVLKINMKSLGWTNIPRFRKLKEKVESIIKNSEMR